MNTTIHSKIKGMSPQFLVSDLNRSIEFYTSKLGFEESFRYEDFYSGIIKDGCSIHLKLSKPSIEERENRRSNEHLDITFSVEGIEDLYEDILDKSIEVIQTLRDMPYGKEFYITDPDGYIIAFSEAK
jgi:catechol 2,3-dioxygenase-like lactoylglutathione lyase family enzyme